MAIGFQALVDALRSHMLRLGVFEAVNGSQPTSSPRTGVTGACWLGNVAPHPGRSGLNTTSAIVTMRARLYLPLEVLPGDAIDARLANAADLLVSSLSADFTLGGLVANIDLLGAAGSGGLTAQDGMVEMPDGGKFRIYDIAVPCLINDAWTQAP